MNAKLCDACKKVISEKDVKIGSDGMRRFELCENCKIKFDAIQDEYQKQYDKLAEMDRNNKENCKQKLKEIGIDYE